MCIQQVYLEPRQDELLKEWAEETGRSESQIVHEALGRWLARQERRRDADAAWQEVLAVAEERAACGAVPGGRTGRVRSSMRMRSG